MIAALFVETDGAYFGVPSVEPWDEPRDARRYTGPYPVVAHPPCQRWGRYWHGAPNKPNQYSMGEDGGCFAAALTAVRNHGGVIEHPAHSHAWRWHGLKTPPKDGGWVKADEFGGWTCHVEQGHYGHISRKATWLYAVCTERPELKWGPSEQRIHPVALAKHGYEKARRIGMMAMVGGKDKTRIRNATPPEFRDLLLAIARSANLTSNMKMDRKEAKEDTLLSASDAPEYPYGLSLSLDEKALAKLGLTQPPAVGTQLTIAARVTVTSASSYQTQGGEPETGSCWQITDMEASLGGGKDAASTLYPTSKQGAGA